MPDGTVAKCYAEDVAEKVAQSAYPQGFAHHYWHPERLAEPARIKTPSRIFLDSMSDLMGTQVPSEQIEQVLDVCRQTPWHTFQLLTKNAPRLLEFQFPANVWVGVSAPPTEMYGNALDERQQIAMVWRQLDILRKVSVPVRWMSIEPLSWDIGDAWGAWLGTKGGPLPLEWVVIGAATNGRKTFQPEREWLDWVQAWAWRENVPVFYKGNLDESLVEEWREEFPQ
jgi:protein gp37